MTDISLNAALITNDAKQPLSGNVTGKSVTEQCDVAEVRENSDARLIAELNRVKAMFQLRTICTAMGIKQ